MTTRFQEPPGFLPWRWPVLVRCPRCDERATVSNGDGTPIRLLCAACALVREWDGETLFVAGAGGEPLQLPRGRATNSWLDPSTGRIWQGRNGKPEWPRGRDECFGAELWLQSECCGGRLLWARNADHLAYLRAYIAGELREDEPGASSKRLSSKLPTWMKEAKHRAEVLRHLDRLQQRLD